MLARKTKGLRNHASCERSQAEFPVAHLIRVFVGGEREWLLKPYPMWQGEEGGSNMGSSNKYAIYGHMWVEKGRRIRIHAKCKLSKPQFQKAHYIRLCASGGNNVIPGRNAKCAETSRSVANKGEVNAIIFHRRRPLLDVAGKYSVLNCLRRTTPTRHTLSL